jgi:hypothetical protein
VGIVKYEYLHAYDDREEASRFFLERVHTVESITIV